MIIADTNVLSEFMKDDPDPHVMAWARTIDADDLTISVVTVQEIDRGVGLLPHGRRRNNLQQRWSALLDKYAEMIVPYDLAAARATAQLLVESSARGHPMSLADAQIAGMCVAREATLATRNTKDFTHLSELDLVNPFDHPRL